MIPKSGTSLGEWDDYKTISYRNLEAKMSFQVVVRYNLIQKLNEQVQKSKYLNWNSGPSLSSYMSLGRLCKLSETLILHLYNGKTCFQLL